MKTAREIVYDKFIKPFENKKKGNIGVELEFPLINKKGGNIETVFVSSIMDYFESKGFSCSLYGTGGEKLFMENSAGDTLSFDNSYNNFEFSMMYSDNLCDIERRFYLYYEDVKEFLQKENHTLCHRGTNPNFPGIEVFHTPFTTYDMVAKYLHKFKGTHTYDDFPAFLSSVQTHLDVALEELAKVYSLFCRLDFVRGLMFGNSPDFEGKGYRIFRDYLWEKSGFSNSPNITGCVDKSFENTDDILDFFLTKGIFNRIRNNSYEVFEPVSIESYFKRNDACEKDIDCYLSFCNTEITSRGTLEVRSDCAQPYGRFFMPPAFNLGILHNADKAKKRLDEFFAENNIKMQNSRLREYVCKNEEEKIAPQNVLSVLCSDMTTIAREGLVKRGKGEERLLNK